MSGLSKNSMFLAACFGACVVGRASAQQELQICAYDDVPGPVDIRVAAKDAFGDVLDSQVMQWPANNDGLSCRSTTIPLATVTLRFTFINDECPNNDCPDPADDRNAYIDKYTLQNKVIVREAETFDRTGGPDALFSGCTQSLKQGAVWGAECGNEGDWVEYDFGSGGRGIPTVSDWGLSVFVLLLLVSGTVIHRRAGMTAE